MIDASKNINNTKYADEIMARQANDPKVAADALILNDIMQGGPNVHIGPENDAPAEDQAEDVVSQAEYQKFVSSKRT